MLCDRSSEKFENDSLAIFGESYHEILILESLNKFFGRIKNKSVFKESS